MKRILILDREFGAGASTVADRLARRLGWKLFDHALTEEIARLARVPPEFCEPREERMDPWVQRLVKVMWLGSIEQILFPPDLEILDTDRLVSLEQQVIQNAVEAGPCVIVGRGAPYYFRERRDTFCVFLYAPRELRFRRVRGRVDSDARAVELVDTMDEERRKFIKHYFGCDWPNRHFFHAMLNTAAGVDATVEAILYLMAAANRQEETRK